MPDYPAMITDEVIAESQHCPILHALLAALPQAADEDERNQCLSAALVNLSRHARQSILLQIRQSMLEPVTYVIGVSPEPQDEQAQ